MTSRRTFLITMAALAAAPKLAITEAAGLETPAAAGGLQTPIGTIMSICNNPRLPPGFEPEDCSIVCGACYDALKNGGVQ